MATYPYTNSPEWSLHFQLFPSEYDQPGSDDDVIGTSFHGAKENILTTTVTEKELYEAAPLYDELGGPWYNTAKVEAMVGFGSICYEKIVFLDHIAASRWAALKWFKIGEGPTHYTLYYNLMAFGPGGAFGITGFMPQCSVPTIGYNMTLGYVVDSTGVLVKRVIPKGALAGYTTDSDIAAYAQAVQCKGSYSSMPYGNWKVICYLWITPSTPDPTDNDGPATIKLWHVIHDTITRASATPADGTPILDGGEVTIAATAAASCTLSTFTVDSVDRRSSNPFLKENVSADVHVTAIGDYGTITKQAGSVVSETLTLQVCANCGPVTWSDDGSLAALGLSIGAATGIISGTIPYGTTPGTYPIVVTATNNSRSSSRTFNIVVSLPPVYGNVWSALANLGVDANAYVSALCQTSTGRLLVGTGGTASCAIYKCDDPDAVTPTFTDVDPTAAVINNNTASPGTKSNASISSIRQLASGRLIAVADNNTSWDPIVFTSDDDGNTWVVKLGAGGATSYVDVKDVVEITAGALISFAWGTTKIITNKSTDNGENWTGGYQFTTGATLGKKLLAVGDGNAVMTGTSPAGGSNIILFDGTAGASKLAIAVNSAKCGQMAKNGAGTILTPVQTVLYSGGTDGAAFTPLYTAAANIGTLSYLTQNTLIMGLDGTIAVLRSTDNGTTWGATTGTIAGAQCYCSLMLASGKVLLGTDGAATNLYRSES